MYDWFKGLTNSRDRSGKVAHRSYMMTMPSHDDSCSSCAVEALVEDADQLAAGIWPPSKYPCSFCRREFRSAQALGGHMNVHRRDRAHLRHYSPPPPSHTFSALPAAARDRSLFQNHKKYSANLSAQYTNQPLMEFKMPPISPSDLNDLSLATLYPSPSSGYPSHTTASLPLRSQQVASETAASLLQYPQGRQRCTSSDLDSFKPPPFAESTDITSHFGKTGMKEKSREIVTLPSLAPSPPSSNASSCTSLPSVVDAATRKRKFSILEVDEENCFIENDRKHLLRQILTGAENPEEFLKAADIREAQTEAATDSSRMLWAKEAYACACGDRSEGDVDLELRLGRRQIFPKS